MADALETTEIWQIKESIQRRQGNIATQVACWTIYDMCMVEDMMPGDSRFMRWWDQDVGQEVE